LTNKKLKLKEGVATTTYGALCLKNDFAKMYISHIQIVDVSNPNKPQLVAQYDDSYAPGSLIDLSNYKTTSKYTVTFRAAEPGQIKTIYKYDLNPYVQLSQKKKTQLNAINDFIIQNNK
jgi:hypothetical protein